MAADTPHELRPRTTGEIADAAWRLALADAPLLLALSNLFLVPAFVVLLLLLTEPKSESLAHQAVLPVVLACLVPSTGLGTGACQEVFRRRAEGLPPGLAGCLGAALRQGLGHATARAIVFFLILSGLGCFVIPGLGLWAACAGVHPILAAGDSSGFAAIPSALREGQRQMGKAVMILLSRLVLLGLALVNLHLTVRVALWVLDSLAGFDMAVAGLVLTPSNPVYSLALALFAWLLHAPYAEACNWLLHVDARVRYEGLDLRYRAKRLFPTRAASPARVLLLAACGLLFLLPDALAADDSLARIGMARKEVRRIQGEVRAADPYRDGIRWERQLRDLGARLTDEAHPGPRTRWFGQLIEGFGQRRKEDVLKVLEELDRRLALVEDSLRPSEPAEAAGWDRERIRSLLRPESEDPAQRPKNAPRSTRRQKVEDDEIHRPDFRPDGDEGPARPRPKGPGVVSAQPSDGLGTTGWMVLLGLLLAVVGIALVRFLRQLRSHRPTSNPGSERPAEPSLESILAQPDRYTAEGLWRLADEHAQAGRLIEAVRALYLAILALLHRANRIRCERTRTNGEYVDQLRSRTELYEPMRDLTVLFEVKYYGERTCRPADYENCRGLAERIRAALHE